MLKRSFFLLAIGLGLLFGAVNSRAQMLSGAESEKLIEYLRKNDATSALELIRNKKLTGLASKQLQQAEKFLEGANSRSEESIERTELRGDVARLFGHYDVALTFYQNALDQIEQRVQKLGGYRLSDFYNVEYKAAICAFWLGNYERAFSLLNHIEKNGDTWVKDFGRNKANLLKEFVVAPEDASLRIKFAKGFWLDNAAAVGSQSADAIRFSEETLKLNLTREETKQIYILIRNAAQEGSDIETAESYLKKMIAEFSNEDFVAETVFSTARFYFEKGKYAESRKRLDWIVQNEKLNGRFVPLAYLGLSEVYEKLGDEAAMLKFLELAARNPNAAATNRGIMDTSDTRQVALVRLGKYYQAKGDYEEALKYFTEWQPRSWCGNGRAQAAYEKDLYIAECLIKLKREDEALEKHLLPHLKIDGGELYADAKIPRLAVSIYEKRNALEDFLAFITPHAASRYNYTAKTAEKLAQIKVWAKNGEIEKLVAEIKHNNGYVPRIDTDFIRESNWQAVAIAEELSKMNGKEFVFLKKRYEELSATKQESAYGDRAWIIYALGISKAKESEVFLRELLQMSQKANTSAVTGDIVFALSLKK